MLTSVLLTPAQTREQARSKTYSRSYRSALADVLFRQHGDDPTDDASNTCAPITRGEQIEMFRQQAYNTDRQGPYGEI